MDTILIFWQTPRNTNEGDFDNFGDLISKSIIEYFTDREIVWKRTSDVRWYHKNRNIYLTAGSIVKQSNKYTTIWGSGIKELDYKIKGAKNICAVRGPRTRASLIERGFDVPEVYGDPALLCPLLFHVEKKPQYIGIIPHYVDFELVNPLFSKNGKYKVIDLTAPVVKVIDDIAKCKFVFSSSLHGIIVPHAYGIPCLQVEFSDKISGNGVKYLDYFDSLEINNYSPLRVNLQNSLKDIESALMNFYSEKQEESIPQEELLNKLIKQLIEACPFNEKNR